MLSKVRAGLTFSNIVSVIALVFALGLGGAWAATELGKNDVKSKHIKDGQVKDKDLGEGAVTSDAVANGSLLGEDFGAGELPAGPRGPQGVPGEPGEPGDPGAPGSPDTPDQVLSKLTQVDGAGSGLDADTLDGTSSSGYPRIVYRESRQWAPGDVVAGSCEEIISYGAQSTITPGDSLVTTVRGLLWTPNQVNGWIGSASTLNAAICNNGTGTLPQSEFTITWMVLR